MFFDEETHEQLFQKVDQLLKRDREMRAEIELKFTELGLTPEELEKFLSNPDHFTSEEWQEMEEARKELDIRLERSLANIPNPEKTKKAYRSRRIRENWIPVR